MQENKQHRQQASDHLLSRWLRGDTRKNDDKELRRQASQDAFLKEAWAGYAKHIDADHQQGIDELRKRLQQKKEQKPAFFITYRRLAAAASIALVLGFAAYLQWSLSGSGSADKEAIAGYRPSTEPTAQAQQNEADEPTETGIAAADEAASGEAAQPPVRARNLTRPKPVQAISDNTNASGEAPAMTEIATGPAVEAEDDSALAKQTPPDAETQGYADAPAATQRSEKPVAKEPAATGIVRPQPKKDTPSAEDVQPKESSNMLSEVVVAGNDKKKARKDYYWGEAEPEGGFDQYEIYIQENLKYPDEARQQGITGRVTVEFTLGKTGSPSDFKVRPELGGGIEEEAIRLIRKGVKWKILSGKPPLRTSYDITFDLK